MTLDELEVYRMAMSIGQRIWDHVAVWDRFARDVVGKQLVRAADSIAANISEGFGRYFYKENRQFCFYGRGSLFETKTWIEKARARGQISEEDANVLNADLATLGRKLNAYINAIGKNDTPGEPPSGKVREGEAGYAFDSLPNDE